jgi:hypothetical protein
VTSLDRPTIPEESLFLWSSSSFHHTAQLLPPQPAWLSLRDAYPTVAIRFQSDRSGCFALNNCLRRMQSGSFLAREFEKDPAKAHAEYGAEFRTDIEAFVSRDAVEAYVIKNRFEIPPMNGVRYVALVDPSGGSADSMTLGIAHHEDEPAVLNAVREVKLSTLPRRAPDCSAAVSVAVG